MNSEPSPSKIESLRAALQTVEHARGSARDSGALAAVKRAILNRLADCEAELAIIQSFAPAFCELDVSEFAALLPTISLAEIQSLEEATSHVPLYKLD